MPFLKIDALPFCGQNTPFMLTAVKLRRIGLCTADTQAPLSSLIAPLRVVPGSSAYRVNGVGSRTRGAAVCGLRVTLYD